MMMSFCKKSVHCFLSLTIPMNNTDTILQEKPSFTTKCVGLSSGGVGGGGGGLGLITATGDVYRTPNVLESATVKSSSPMPPQSSPVKKDPGGIGFLDDVGGGVDGLMSCTESLGFESSDERRIDDEIDELSSPAMTSYKVKWRKIAERRRRREVKKFPPPLSSLNHNGQPSFFLRPVRKDGRLELTEVRIDRPEILRAYREDGRLRLHLIRDNQELEDINEDPVQVLQDQENKEQEQEEDVKENEEDQEDEREDEEWKFPVTGEGFRRCHELSTHHHDYHLHHHHHHLWRQHCVTTS